MFDVLVFVYENYWRGDACPPGDQLGRKLSAVGFEADEIEPALSWLNGLRLATREVQDAAQAVDALPPSATSMRVYAAEEARRLDAQCQGFLLFLEASGALPPAMREVVVERAIASNADTLGLEDLKIIVLMVFWSFGQEPDALVLDELCDDSSERIAH